MTPQDIAAKAGRKIDEKILKDPPKEGQAEFVLDKVNDFIRDIAKKKAPIAEATVAGGSWVDLPADFIKVHRDEEDDAIITKDGNDYYGTFEVRQIGMSTQVKFADTGSYVIKYEQAPAEIVSLSATINMHPFLLDLGVIYLAWQYVLKENSSATAGKYPVSAAQLEAEYNKEKGERFYALNNPTNEPKTIKNVYGGW